MTYIVFILDLEGVDSSAIIRKKHKPLVAHGRNYTVSKIKLILGALWQKHI